MGTNVQEYANKARHVRDIWVANRLGELDILSSEIKVGSLLVTRRHYNLDNERQCVPGHVGIVTRNDGEVVWIHASAPAGKVEERSLKSLRTVLGAKAVILS